jgi:AcrR family transcriptional regulator
MSRTTPRTTPQTTPRTASRATPRLSEATSRRVPRQERSKLLVDCIRIAASEILEKDGPKALTTNNIAKRAGVSIGSLYQYFANKEEILEDVFRLQADRNFEESRQWADWVKDQPLRDIIRLLVERTVRRHRSFHSIHPEFYRKHHDDLHVGLRPRDGLRGLGESHAVAWLGEVFEARRDELRIPSARLASVALAHGMSGILHGIVESDLNLLYDESLEVNLVDMLCAYLLREEADLPAS